MSCVTRAKLLCGCGRQVKVGGGAQAPSAPPVPMPMLPLVAFWDYADPVCLDRRLGERARRKGAEHLAQSPLVVNVLRNHLAVKLSRQHVICRRADRSAFVRPYPEPFAQP